MQKNMLNSSNIIHQDTFYKLEALCTQQAPPACMSGCPLHVDARTLCKQVGNGVYKEAFAQYQKTVPFARLVAHLCDAPCEQPCKRGEKGGAIQIQKIEQFVADTAGFAPKKPLLMPKKKAKIAIIGASLRGLTTALLLGKKGYAVTIFEKTDTLGGKLQAITPDKLPQGLLKEEIDALLALPSVTVEKNTPMALEKEETLQILCTGYDGVYLATTCPQETLAQPDTLLVDSFKNLVAGHRPNRLTKGFSAVYEVYDGRSAAYTLDRLIQKVSLTEGRSEEGSHETALFTSLDGVEINPAPPKNSLPFTEDQAKTEANRCLQCTCLECVKKCGFLQHYKADPSKYLREVINNLGIALGTHHANTMINSCALCGQCEAVCPNGLDMRQVFLAARERMVQTKKMPASAFEFALQDMAYSLSDDFYLVRHQPARTSSCYVFFPGCQLPASEPSLVQTAYNDLCTRLEGGVGLWLGCCGIMSQWAGKQDTFKEVSEKLRDDWEKMGKPTVLTACPSCEVTLQEQGITVESLFKKLALTAETPPKAISNKPMVLHHACGARHNDSLKEQVRVLCAEKGIALTPEMEDSEQSPCCGYGGLAPFSVPDVADDITKVALEQLATPETPVLTYCVNCRDRYLDKGRNAFHLLELLYPNTQINHTMPTMSARQYNRAKLQQDLLKNNWHEEKEGVFMLPLQISDELEKKLDKEHILHTDISKAIQEAEINKNKLVNGQTGYFVTSYRPQNVTFWVEYTFDQGTYTVHNAYSHRMQAVVSNKLRGGQ